MGVQVVGLAKLSSDRGRDKLESLILAMVLIILMILVMILMIISTAKKVENSDNSALAIYP